MTQRAPVTTRLAEFISGFAPAALPPAVSDHARLLVFDGVGTLVAATHPSVTANRGIGEYALAHGGQGASVLVGRGARTDPATAALANGTLGYAADFEPHHPEGILHPIAVMVPAALAVAEPEDRSGGEFLAAVALGCEVTYRVSMAMNPRALYARGFHPSAIAGSFGAAAAAAFLMGLDAGQTVRALGLAALQTSGLMAWEDDPREDARPFQMGLAARNGVMAATLARAGFGAPDRIFDGGHVVVNAYSDAGSTGPLVDGLGERWDGVSELAIKPYPCVSFLHPALDALDALLRAHALRSTDIDRIELRFASAGAHCVDDNPLKGHSAQYILPVRVARGRLDYLDLFEDRRETNPEVARLAAATTVIHDEGELDRRFPDLYIGDVTLALTDGRRLSERREVARGYPETPLTQAEIETKFHEIVGGVATPERRHALARAAWLIGEAENVAGLSDLLGVQPATTPAVGAVR